MEDGMSCTGKRWSRQSERRDHIMKEAIDLFISLGYEATSMSQIAAKVGGSKSTLWRYFATKEDIFAAIVEDDRIHTRHGLNLGNAGDDMRDVIRSFCLDVITESQSRRSLAIYRLIAGEHFNAPDLGSIFFQRGFGETENRLKHYLEACVRKGELKQADPAEMSNFILSLCTGFHHLRAVLSGCEKDADKSRMRAALISDQFLSIYGAQRDAVGVNLP